tara:strand:+ start:280 stop:531 length:252 start_codon:yes stop_codon:yes gene_type:complete
MKRKYDSNLVSLDNVIFETAFVEELGVDITIKEENEDTIYLNNLDKIISYTIYTFLGVSLAGFIFLLFFIDTIRTFDIVITYI